MVSRGSRWIRACPITTAGETYFPGHLKHDWRAPFDGPRTNARHLQHADAIAHKQTVVRIWVWV